MIRALLGLYFVFFCSLAHALDFALMGDGGDWNPKAISGMQSMQRHGVRDLILAGDNLYSLKNGYDSVWSQWKKQGFRLDLVAIGNHTRGYPEEIKYFNMPGEFYSRTYDGIIRFVILNSNNTKNVDTQMQFLDNQLESAREPFVFLVYHHPTYTLSKHHNWEEKPSFQKSIRIRLDKYRSRITGVLLGHDHIASAIHFGDLPAIVSGAVQEQLEGIPVNNVQAGKTVKTAWMYNKTPHWVRLFWQSNSDNVTIQFVRSKDDFVGCTAHLRTGQKMTLESNCNARKRDRRPYPMD